MAVVSDQAGVSEMRPGDVLLFNGKGFISWAIRKIDGTDVNHAAIALDASTLGEAGGRGLQRTPIAAAVARNNFVKIRRHSDADVTPVVKVAVGYLDDGLPYAYQQIVLLALLASTRRLPLGGTARRMLRSILDHAAAAVNGFIDAGGRRSMICSEFVYRAFAEVPDPPPDRYRVLVQVGDIAYDVTATSLAEWALAQPDSAYDGVGPLPVSFAPTPVATGEADEIAEDDLAPLIADWAEENGLVDDDMPPPPPPSFDSVVIPEPTDDELLASLVSFSAAFADSTSDGPPSFEIGATIGVAAAKGAIEGLLRPSIESNFVTPGDLLLSPTLIDVATARGGA